MRVAALDLGTNTFLLLVADVEDHQIKKVIADEITVTRLGQNVHLSGEFHQEALQRADACFADYRKIIDSLNVDHVLAVATSAARDVSNASEFLKLGEKHGIPIRVISGEKEAELTFLGSVFDSIKPGSKDLCENVAVIDVGGGSTEIIVGSMIDSIQGISLPLGSVRLTEKFISAHPISSSELSKMNKHIDSVIADSEVPRWEATKLVAVAGTPTTLCCVQQAETFDEERVHGHRLALSEVHEFVEQLSAMSVEERQQLPGMEPKRADVIVAGASILEASVRSLGLNEMFVSTKGVRYGVALRMKELQSE